MNIIYLKVKEVFFSLLPVVLIVTLLNFTLTPLPDGYLTKFLLGSLFIIIGMPLFLLGIDIGVEPLGTHLSRFFIKSNRPFLLLAGVMLIGFLISIAEPDLQILGQQVDNVTKGQITKNELVVIVSMGIGLLLSLGIFRILKKIALPVFLTVIYLVIFILSLFSEPDFLAIAFDASGVTTGSITVPFMLAIAAGVSSITRSRDHQETDSFGVLGIASAGAILAVLVQGLLSGTDSLQGTLPVSPHGEQGVFVEFLRYIPVMAKETLLALLPILTIFLVLNFLWIKLPGNKMKTILQGLLYTLTGLTLFLTGANAGFMEVSSLVGYQLASLGKPWLLILIGMIFGAATIPAEPSVHILTEQIESETAGSIKSKMVMISLALGVAAAVGLSILRLLVPALQLWHLILPGMVIALGLSYFIPRVFVGIAFDSGGVASGTMTATFILPFAQGAAEFVPTANVVLDGFGVIAIVAITPLISVQILGLIYKFLSRPKSKHQVKDHHHG